MRSLNSLSREKGKLKGPQCSLSYWAPRSCGPPPLPTQASVFRGFLACTTLCRWTLLPLDTCCSRLYIFVPSGCQPSEISCGEMGRSSQSSELLVSRTWEIMESAEPVLTITLGNDLNRVWFGFVKWFFPQTTWTFL